MNVNWWKIGKVASVGLSIAGTIVGAVINNHERKQETIETTKKLFKEHIENK